jgi:uncharacterized membrane protein YfcA
MDTILNAIHVVGNVLLHSLRTATFCWIAAGLVIAILIVRGVIKKKNGKKQDTNYGMEGMSLGMCFGLLAGTMFDGYIGVGISIGMVIGLVIGMCVSKKQGDESK